MTLRSGEALWIIESDESAGRLAGNKVTVEGNIVGLDRLIDSAAIAPEKRKAQKQRHKKVRSQNPLKSLIYFVPSWRDGYHLAILSR